MPEAVIGPVRIVDNGLSSFLPPTFTFELRDSSDIVVGVVSSLTHEDRPEERDHQVLEAVARDGPWAVGYLSSYDAGPDARVPGLRFVVTAIVDAPRLPID